MNCSICYKKIEEGRGNNAQPVNDGQCCSECNEGVVIPSRIKDSKDSFNEWLERGGMKNCCTSTDDIPGDFKDVAMAMMVEAVARKARPDATHAQIIELIGDAAGAIVNGSVTHDTDALESIVSIGKMIAGMQYAITRPGM